MFSQSYGLIDVTHGRQGLENQRGAWWTGWRNINLFDWCWLRTTLCSCSIVLPKIIKIINKNWCFLLFLIETWLSLSSLGTNWEFQHVSTFFFVTSWLQRSTGVAVVSVSKMSQADRLDDGYTMECKTSKQRVTQLTVGVDGLAVVMKKNFGKKVMRNRIWGSWRHAWTMDNTQTKNTFQRYTFIPFLYQR